MPAVVCIGCGERMEDEEVLHPDGEKFRRTRCVTPDCPNRTFLPWTDVSNVDENGIMTNA